MRCENENGALIFEREYSTTAPDIVIAEVLAAGRQLVMLKRGQDFAKLEEEAFAGFVAVGIHVELGFKFQVQGFKSLPLES